ncbi:MAG: glycogen synthase [Anaerolineaceae bacterium]|nr:glycogen synthase [Anaerolineaceae bacterium]
MTNRLKKINVLFASAEIAPFAKVGGLGDVASALPTALKREFAEELDIRSIMPFHSVVKTFNPARKKIGDFSFKTNGKELNCELFISEIEGVPIYLIDNEEINHNSPVYNGDWELDGLKYASFSLALLEAARFLGWKFDILHANDWHTALAVYALKTKYKKDPFFKDVKTILSIHNLPYNGWGSQNAMTSLGFTASLDKDLPDWARFVPLPLGLSAADKIIAVSPGYAREILTPEFGCGMESYLQKHKDKLLGILNGLDENEWDPSLDTQISHQFSVATLSDRKQNKLDLQKALKFKVDESIPLLTVVSRLTPQKGIHNILEVLPELLDKEWQFVLLGTGSDELEEKAKELSRKYPKRIASILKYDDAIARMLYASGDIFLMPSEYEPCGLSQMIAMRYGNLPLATETGGLADSIIDYSNHPEQATGFLYQEKNSEGLKKSLTFALKTYQDKEVWQKMQLNAMKADFSWPSSALLYMQNYKTLHKDIL